MRHELGAILMFLNTRNIKKTQARLRTASENSNMMRSLEE